MKPLQFNNKHYQECDVVLLQTDKAENSLYASYDKILNYYSGHLTQDYLKNVLLAKSYHLYILSNNDVIKEGDWCYSTEYGRIVQSDNSFTSDEWKKIIATTDGSLVINNGTFDDGTGTQLPLLNTFLPQIPKSFIEKYITEHNKGNVISNVLVEIEERKYAPNVIHQLIEIWDFKLSQTNEISILTKKKTLLSNLQSELQKYIDKRHNQDECSGFVDGFERACELGKESYSREEVVELLHKRMKFTLGLDYDESTTDNWAQQNLK